LADESNIENVGGEDLVNGHLARMMYVLKCNCGASIHVGSVLA